MTTTLLSIRCPIGAKVTLVEGRALVGELADERTTSSAVQSCAVDLQFNGQVMTTRYNSTHVCRRGYFCFLWTPLAPRVVQRSRLRL